MHVSRLNIVRTSGSSGKKNYRDSARFLAYAHKKKHAVDERCALQLRLYINVIGMRRRLHRASFCKWQRYNPGYCRTFVNRTRIDPETLVINATRLL